MTRICKEVRTKRVSWTRSKYLRGDRILTATAAAFDTLRYHLKTSHQNEKSLLDEFQDMLVTCFRPRDNHIRTIILLLIADKLISDLGVHSERGIVYIFSKEKFDWSEEEYSTFKAVSTCTRGFGTMLMTPLLKMMSVSDPIISYLGILSSTLSYYFCGLSLAPWMLWMAATLGSFRSMTTAVAR